ncbi:hypothetical protein [Lysobacter gummosus]|uniref:hypothetical protein n=1 Tax=Lysobacter gummosus TaxID=262324 RepID=UPI00363D2D37
MGSLTFSSNGVPRSRIHRGAPARGCESLRQVESAMSPKCRERAFGLNRRCIARGAGEVEGARRGGAAVGLRAR